MKPYSQACENNKIPIFSSLVKWFIDVNHVLEIGSGTGQHAVFFAEQFPSLFWQPSDLLENHPGIIQWIDETQLSNIQYPISLDVKTDVWPDTKFDAVYTANTCHIMHWNEVVTMFEGVSAILSGAGLFIIYGPFNYNNAYTSLSNEHFDRMLRTKDPESGLRNIEDLIALADQNAFSLMEDNDMPANNRLLIFKRNNLDNRKCELNPEIT